MFRIQSGDSVMGRFYCIVFTEYMLAGKTLLDYINLFSPNHYKKNDKIMYKYFKDKYDKNAGLKFRLKNIDETRSALSYLLEVIKHNALMGKKHKKTCSTLNYLEHFLLFISAVTGYVSISAFASLVGIPVGITSSPV